MLYTISKVFQNARGLFFFFMFVLNYLNKQGILLFSINFFYDSEKINYKHIGFLSFVILFKIILHLAIFCYLIKTFSACILKELNKEKLNQIFFYKKLVISFLIHSITKYFFYYTNIYFVNESSIPRISDNSTVDRRDSKYFALT